MGFQEEDDDIISETNDDAGNKFVDREIHRQAFQLHLNHVKKAGIDDGGVLWIYSGSAVSAKLFCLKNSNG